MLARGQGRCDSIVMDWQVVMLALHGHASTRNDVQRGAASATFCGREYRDARLAGERRDDVLRVRSLVLLAAFAVDTL